jgi:hypothetical protein
MFTWVCPQCGREVPPHLNECPNCQQNAAAASAQQNQPQAAPSPPPQQPQQVPAYYPPQQPVQQQYAPPAHGQQPYYPPPPNRGLNLPVWLLTVIFALGIGGIVVGIYALLQTNRSQTGSGPAPTAAVENPAAKPGAKVNALQKYIEVSGVRFVLDAKKKTQARFVLINHSEATIDGLTGNVTIWGRTKKSEEDARGSFTFNTNIGPFESKELTVPMNTKLKIYELPDWQNITADVQITAPGA